MALLEEAHVATVHGAAYGMSPYLRVSTATDDASLAEGCRRIAGVLRRAALTDWLRSDPAATSDADGFIALIGACWAEYPGVILDVDGEMPELRALASHYAGKGGALWAAESDGQLVGMVATVPHGARRLGDLPRLHAAVDAWQRPRRTACSTLPRRMPAPPAPTRLVLWSDTRFDRAHRFYEKRGYVRHGADPRAARHLEFAGIRLRQAGRRRSRCWMPPPRPRRSGGWQRSCVACVDAGASVSYLPPLAPDVARAFWRSAWRRMSPPARASCWRPGTTATLVGTVHAGVRLVAEPAASRRGAEAAGAPRGAPAWRRRAR